MNETTNIYILAGPTASGKSAVALELAKHLPIEIISADSRQVYKYLTIGTAKPSKDEMQVCPHHFVDTLDPNEYFSAGVFGDEAGVVAEEIKARGNVPIVAGGSGLYIKSLCEGFFDDETTSSEVQTIRAKLENDLNSNGKDYLYKLLEEVDPKSAERYHDKNPRRLIRALEYFYSTGVAFSESQLMQKSRNFECKYFGIDHSRSYLYERINARTDQMWKDGLLDETRSVLDMGYERGINALNTVGYKETIMYVDGLISEEEAISKIKQSTRRYAKRQLTWFKNQYPQMVWLQGSLQDNAKAIAKIIRADLGMN